MNMKESKTHNELVKVRQQIINKSLEIEKILMLDKSTEEYSMGKKRVVLNK